MTRVDSEGKASPLFSGGRCLLISLVLLALLCPSAGLGAMGLQDLMAECATLQNDTERLRCYDNLAGGKLPSPPPISVTHKEEKKGRLEKAPSMLTHLWELDKETRKEFSIIRPHRTNYMLPVAYNSSPNRDMTLDFDPKAKAQKTEAKFQLSFKVKLWEDVASKDMDLWFAYTQLSFWQLYNSEFSSPFRDTNYEPELLLNIRTNYDLPGLKGRMITLGLNHQSNGRSNPLSRSWNRLIANFGFERNDFSLLLKTWYRIPVQEKGDDNPDIDKFLGYGELWGYYDWKGQRLSGMVRNNLRARGNRGAIQVDWRFPLLDRVHGYIQYFNGYGESLLDYNKSVNRVSIGVMLPDWK